MAAARFDDQKTNITEGECSEKQRVSVEYDRLFNSNIRAVMSACETEFNFLTKAPHSNSGYWGSSAVKKLEQYKAQLREVANSPDPLNALKAIYENVEKDFGRSSRAAKVLMIGALVILMLTVAAIIIAMPHIFALSMTAAFSIVGAGVVASTVAMVGGSYGAASKQTEGKSFKAVLSSFNKNFSTIFSAKSQSNEKKSDAVAAKNTSSSQM